MDIYKIINIYMVIYILMVYLKKKSNFKIKLFDNKCIFNIVYLFKLYNFFIFCVDNKWVNLKLEGWK